MTSGSTSDADVQKYQQMLSDAQVQHLFPIFSEQSNFLLRWFRIFLLFSCLSTTRGDLCCPKFLKTFHFFAILQERFGSDDGSGFKMFDSESGSDLMFKDSTKMLYPVTAKTHQEYLGQDYVDTVKGTDPFVFDSSSCIFSCSRENFLLFSSTSRNWSRKGNKSKRLFMKHLEQK